MGSLALSPEGFAFPDGNHGGCGIPAHVDVWCHCWGQHEVPALVLLVWSGTQWPPSMEGSRFIYFLWLLPFGVCLLGKKKSHTQGVVPFPSPWIEAAASHPESPGHELEVRPSSCALSRAGQCLSFFLRLLQAGDVVATKGD